MLSFLIKIVQFYCKVFSCAVYLCSNSAPTCQENTPSEAALAYLSSSQGAPTPLDQKEKGCYWRVRQGGRIHS